jgi:hypothetical protein
MIKDSGPKRVSILIAASPGVWGLAPMKKDSGPKKSRLNLQSRLLHAGFTHGPLFWKEVT